MAPKTIQFHFSLIILFIPYFSQFNLKHLESRFTKWTTYLDYFTMATISALIEINDLGYYHELDRNR